MSNAKSVRIGDVMHTRIFCAALFLCASADELVMEYKTRVVYKERETFHFSITVTLFSPKKYRNLEKEGKPSSFKLFQLLWWGWPQISIRTSF